jgi:acyl-CoA thioesterase YciA
MNDQAPGNATAADPQQIRPPHREPTLRVVPMPHDVNVNGDIFGGWIMSQVDIAGAIPAVRRAKGRVATVAVNSFVFKQPVMLGDTISLYAWVARTGRTSITCEVEVFAERWLDRDASGYGRPAAVKVTEATLTYVAIGENRRPRELPPA